MPSVLSEVASRGLVCNYALNPECVVKELQSGAPDILMQLAPIATGCVNAGFGPGIAPERMALVYEDRMVHQTGQNVQARVRHVFRGKLRVISRGSLSVPSTDNNVGRDRELTEPGVVHPEAWKVAGGHRKGRL